MSVQNPPLMNIEVGGEQLQGRLILREDFRDLNRWVQCENDGAWTAGPDGLRAEWQRNSPSLFLREKVAGDIFWRVRVARLAPTPEFLTAFKQSKHTQGSDPLVFYNFNFWLRTDSPDRGDFMAQYPTKLGSGWNGMGDDFWHSYFTTVVRNPTENWVRLRRGPGYEKMCDVNDIVPHLPYDQPHTFSFLIRRGVVRGFFDGRELYRYADSAPHSAGHIGLCVWLCTVRFSELELYAVES
jgi:hypothetical protein